MIYERRAILSLIAMGRITAVEGERLLLAWHETREWVWIAAGLAFCFLQSHPHFRLGGLGNLLYTVAANGAHALQTTASMGLKKNGGTV